MRTSVIIYYNVFLLAFFVFDVHAAEPPNPQVPVKQLETPLTVSSLVMPRVFVQGFTVRELPVQLTSLNNIEYAPDGRLFAGGYDGRFHLLRDTDGDGLEDQVDTFWSESGPNYPLGMVVKDGDPHAILADELVRFRDTDGDGVPDKRETVIKDIDDPTLVTAVTAPYLNHRRVDSSMALAYGPDGAWYVTMGNAGHDNPYWQESFEKGKKPSGTARYTTDKRRGCLLRIGNDGTVEQLASGLRYIMSLQFNAQGDLFGTDQEGATWCPNGNPFDELLHIQAGRHYGFPPRHPQFLPDVIDEPSVWDYRPQHQSTCGFRFNTPATGRGRFGPKFWEDDAIVTGESRGKLWRTSLVKTAAGYVAQSQLIANLGLLAVDCAISPHGDLVVCCHTGKPDWGNGPKGDGRIFKFTYSDPNAAQPGLAWAASETESIVAFDRPLSEIAWNDVGSRAKIAFGRYVAAGDASETIRPGYKIVQMQQRQQRHDLAVKNVRLGEDRTSIIIETPKRSQAFQYAIHIAPRDAAVTGLDLEYDLAGVAADWLGQSGAQWRGWLPHPDTTASKQFTRASAMHDALWKHLDTPGSLQLRGQLDLFNMLQPTTQPDSELDYTPTPETVTMIFRSDATLKVEASGAKIERVSDYESHCTFANVAENRWTPIAIALATPVRQLDVSYYTDRDLRPRAAGTRRFLMPFATPGSEDRIERHIPELVGGDWDKGHALFNGKAACVTCHPFRGEGFAVGADLNNLVHRDYASVLRDVIDPNAAINPDAIGYIVRLDSGEVITGTRVGETSELLSLAQAGGKVVKISKKEIEEVKPMTTSLMPVGLDKNLSPEELRDLMTYLLTEK
ncbi:MAG: heme-binding protein [Planctomycetota bacterium]|nr:heme-binding protein [Planctomycetota bacterium]